MGLSLYILSQENHDCATFCTDSVQFINMTTTCNILQATKNQVRTVDRIFLFSKFTLKNQNTFQLKLNFMLIRSNFIPYLFNQTLIMFRNTL